MSVYTQLTTTDVRRILADYQLGELHSFQGISAGIENSNFFLNTDKGRYVLTIFERMSVEELPYFMQLMLHLAAGGLCCPQVQLRRNHESLFTFTDAAGRLHHGCIVSCLPGKVLPILNIAQLYSAGQALARLHLAARDFPMRRASPSDLNWLTAHIEAVLPATSERYGQSCSEQLQQELRTQQQQQPEGLPQSVIHGDFFRDNMLFSGDEISGVIDLYYAHDAPCVLDIAIAINALATDIAGEERPRAAAFVAGYQQLRRLQQEEWSALPGLLRLAALRFWVSRLYDACFPREGDMTTILDPEEYHLKLLFHQQHPDFSRQLREHISKEFAHHAS